MNIRAAIYTRYSSDKQRQSSTDDQVRECRRKAEAEDMMVAEIFSDEEISGSDRDRPAYLRMQAAAKRGAFDVLIVHHLSRLARDSMESERVIRVLEFNGVRIVSLSDGYDSQSKSKKIQRGFAGLMNEKFLDDLADNVHRGLTGVALKAYWAGGRPYGYKLVPDTFTNRHGESESRGTLLQPHDEQALIVREIFQRYVDGESCYTIARGLNARGIASPGSSWNRTVRRCQGWVASAVRTMLRNPLYRGHYVWNRSAWVKDPESGKRVRRETVRGEVLEQQIESIRIVSDALWHRAQNRTRVCADSDVRLKSGGKPKFILSGLMTCQCGSHFTMTNATGYSCGGRAGGAPCSNHERVRRDHAEKVILGNVLDRLRDPAIVEKMRDEVEAQLNRVLAARSSKAVSAPKELQELDARIVRLKERLKAGDPDMDADELQAVLERALAKRADLARGSDPAAQRTAQIQRMLPKAKFLQGWTAALERGLSGDPAAVLKARGLLREYLGPIKMESPVRGELWAVWSERREALVPSLRAVGTDGSGGRI